MVANTMKNKYAERFAVGIIDRDKKEVSYLKEFSLVANDDHLFVFKHGSKPHFIIQISPAVEKFILAAVEEKGVSLADFSIPSDFEELKKRTKSVTSKNDDNFKRLFKSIADTKCVMRLKTVLQYLVQQRYSVDEEYIRQLFA